VSSHLHVYVGPYVRTGPDSDGGPRREEFDRLHVDNLADKRLGYRPGDGFAWTPNSRHAPGLQFFDRSSNSSANTLCKLWPDAEVQFGVVAYYL